MERWRDVEGILKQLITTNCAWNPAWMLLFETALRRDLRRWSADGRETEHTARETKGNYWLRLWVRGIG